MAATVHIEPVVTDYLSNEQIVVSLLDEVVLGLLKCIRFILGNPLPTGCECGSAGDEVLEISKPYETPPRSPAPVDTVPGPRPPVSYFAESAPSASANASPNAPAAAATGGAG